MNDFEYDVYLKKKIANQAKYRKRGSKSKKCPLSTDRMTRKQWIERNGAVVSYSMGRPMNWEKFMELPHDLKEEYINGLITKYSVNAKTLAEMFGVSHLTVFRMVDREGLNVKFVRGRKMNDEQKTAFEKFLRDEEEEPVEMSTPVHEQQIVSEEITETSADSTESPKNTPTRLDGFTMNFSGDLDIDMIANSIRYIIGKNTNAKLQITCVFD